MFGFESAHPWDILGCVITLLFFGYLLSWQIDPTEKDETADEADSKEKKGPKKEDSKVKHDALTVGEHTITAKPVSDSYNFASRTAVALVFTLAHVVLYSIFMLIGPDWFFRKDQFPFQREVSKNLATGLVLGGGLIWSLLVMHESWIDFQVEGRVLKLVALSSVHAVGLLIFAELAATLPSF